MLLLGTSGCLNQRHALVSAEEDVRRVLEKQVAEWNSGNLAGFMETYAQDERTRFASGGDIILGWQTVFNRYRRKYGDKDTMGFLRFSDIDIRVFDRDSAMAFGRWHLKRKATDSSGLFTLILRKTADGWRIAHDHTSSPSP